MKIQRDIKSTRRDAERIITKKQEFGKIDSESMIKVLKSTSKMI
jgi:hypothetical protein